MRVLVAVKASKESEAGQMPSESSCGDGELQRRTREGRRDAGGRGAAPQLEGQTGEVSGSQRTVIDGPFAETKELIAGFWLWKVKNIDDAVAWLKKAPFDGGVKWKSGRSSSPKTSVKNSRRSCGRRKSACASRPAQPLNRRGPAGPPTGGSRGPRSVIVEMYGTPYISRPPSRDVLDPCGRSCRRCASRRATPSSASGSAARSSLCSKNSPKPPPSRSTSWRPGPTPIRARSPPWSPGLSTSAWSLATTPPATAANSSSC